VRHARPELIALDRVFSASDTYQNTSSLPYQKCRAPRRALPLLPCGWATT